MDVKARRDVINDIQRHLAKLQYYVQAPTGTYIAVWDGALKNYGPNLGYDYGGRAGAPRPTPSTPPGPTAAGPREQRIGPRYSPPSRAPAPPSPSPPGPPPAS